MPERNFVARENELHALNDFLDNALAGQAQICFVEGDAGAGKSALLGEFARRAQSDRDNLLVALGECNAQTGLSDPFLPFREILAQLTGDTDSKVAGGKITSQNATRLSNFVRVSSRTLIEVAPDIIGTLIPGGGIITKAATFGAEKAGWLEKLEKKADASPTKIDESMIFQQITNLLKALSKEQPLLLILDDLQWADNASISLLFHLSRALNEAHILVIGAYRPSDVALGRNGMRHPLETVLNEVKRYQGDVITDLNETAMSSGRAFVEALIDSEPNQLNIDFRAALFAQTSGYPLFTVELLRHLQERGHIVWDDVAMCWMQVGVLDWDALPARVEGVIEERIGRLAENLREILTTASVEGMQFTTQVIARVTEIAERVLLKVLSDELEKRHHLVQESGEEKIGEARLWHYQFSHVLFQKYLYDDLSLGERRLLHGDVARILEALYGDYANMIAIQLARHYDEAGDDAKAVYYYQRAGDQAAIVNGNIEAITLFRKGLTLLMTLPHDPARDESELALQTSLGASLASVKGYGVAEVMEVYDRALALCSQLGKAPSPPILRALAIANVTNADFRQAREFAEQLVTTGQQQQDPVVMVEGHYALGAALFWQGEFALSRSQFEQGIAQYDPEHAQHHAAWYTQNPKVVCSIRLALSLWCLGYSDQATKQRQEALAFAHSLAHSFSLGYCLASDVYLYSLQENIQATLKQSELLIAVGREHQLGQWLPLGLAFHGWAVAMQGSVDAGMGELQEALDVHNVMGSLYLRPFLLALWADIEKNAGGIEHSLELLSEALTLLEKSGGHWLEADLYRRIGDLRFLRGEHAEAESMLTRALEVARAQNARSFELRAAIRLARLWQQQGKSGEAHQLLSPIYGWFSEGFDSVELREAKTLLDTLTHLTHEKLKTRIRML